MGQFVVEEDAISLPRGASAKSRRLNVRWRDRPITAINQGQFRSYLFPVYTPAGVAVTADSPVDHPHHQSLWIGADQFHCRLPYADHAQEEATHNFYVNETFQGRAPGRILALGVESVELATDHLRITQSLAWRGPEEWGAPQGRTVATETRTIDLYPGDSVHVIDLCSRLQPTEWDVSIGPTRHAFIGLRLADGLRVVDGGTLLDSTGRTGSAQIRGHPADWVDCSGRTPGGQPAGVALFPYPPAAGQPWEVTDWGIVTVNPFFQTARPIQRGEALEVAVRILVHDGHAVDARIADLFAAFQRTCRQPAV